VTGAAAAGPAADTAYDVGGRAVISGFVDSHSDLVFAGNRAQEFPARMTGIPYSPGGIRTTVAATGGGGRLPAGSAGGRNGRERVR
jgi:imidazolonepropionase